MQTEKWVTTVFEGGRDTVSITIYFSFKNFVATRKTGSRHHISVSSVVTKLLMSRPNFLINFLNQSIPCCDKPFFLTYKIVSRHRFFFFSRSRNYFPKFLQLKLPSNLVNHPQLSQNFQFKHCEDIFSKIINSILNNYLIKTHQHSIQAIGNKLPQT